MIKKGTPRFHCSSKPKFSLEDWLLLRLWFETAGYLGSSLRLFLSGFCLGSHFLSALSTNDGDSISSDNSVSWSREKLPDSSEIHLKTRILYVNSVNKLWYSSLSLCATERPSAKVRSLKRAQSMIGFTCSTRSLRRSG